MIKYIGSKRRLIPVLGALFEASGATTALDLFTGTTRVAQEFKRRGGNVTAVDTARYSEVFAKCYISTDSRLVSQKEVTEALDYLSNLSGEPGYFTDTFCVQSRFVQPFNGERIDAIRNVLDAQFGESPLFPLLLTSLIEAVDRVDSTTGVQMAYVKKWARRSFNKLELRPPELLPGTGEAIRGDANELAMQIGPFDLAYLDPPYNQHRYFTNYHIWETLVAWDNPEHYGVACKRIDSRDLGTKSAYNRKREMPVALADAIRSIKAEIVILSYNNEAWIGKEDLMDLCRVHGEVAVLAFESKRYVGAQIGIFNPDGQKVGKVSHLRNLEYLVIAGEPAMVYRMIERFSGEFGDSYLGKGAELIAG